MDHTTPRLSFIRLLQEGLPGAMAWVTGNDVQPQLSGLVKFYETPFGGILVEAEIFGLPNADTNGSSSFYAMHIHQDKDCSRHFTKTGEHFNPTGQPHTQQTGRLHHPAFRQFGRQNRLRSYPLRQPVISSKIWMPAAPEQLFQLSFSLLQKHNGAGGYLASYSHHIS